MGRPALSWVNVCPASQLIHTPVAKLVVWYGLSLVTYTIRRLLVGSMATSLTHWLLESRVQVPDWLLHRPDWLV